MRELIKFEFLKLYKAKMNRIVVAGLFTAMVLSLVANVIQAFDTINKNEKLTGFEAIESTKAKAKRHAGEVTEQRVTAELQEYSRLWNDPANKVNIGTTSEFWSEDMLPYYWENRSYHLWLNHNYDEPNFNSWGEKIIKLDLSDGAKFYETRNARIEETFNSASDWEYTEAEKSFWRKKNEKVKTPFTYGYSEGWQQILDMNAFFVFVIIAICMLVANTYAGEYASGTDHIILTAKYGKSKVITAKNIAATLYGLLVLTIHVVLLCAFLLTCYGAEGGNLPIQVREATMLYPITCMQAVLIQIGIYYVGCVGMIAFTLFLSARMKRALPVFATVLAVFMVGMLLKESMTNGIYNHIRILLPYCALNLSAGIYENMISYPFGKLVISYVGMIYTIYGLLVAALMPVVGRGFKRHQVQ